MTDQPRGAFTAAQVDQLLKPINPRRVLEDPRGNAHVSQQDVTAHLTRIFGFGGFDTEILSLDLVFETDRNGDGRRFDACYRATMRLTVRDPEGRTVCRLENGSTGSAQNQNRADAHDLAMKSALSLALKRCTTALGDQFGLSLYNRGQLEALVRGTIVDPRPVEEPLGDVQDGVPQQVSMGTDETAHEHGLTAPPEDPAPAARQTGGGEYDLEDLARQVQHAPAEVALKALWDRHKPHLTADDKSLIGRLVTARLDELREATTPPAEDPALDYEHDAYAVAD